MLGAERTKGLVKSREGDPPDELAGAGDHRDPHAQKMQIAKYVA